MIIGLTGGIGSGKSTVAQFFAKDKHFAIYVADVEAKKLMVHSPEIRSKLIASFGNQTFVNGELNRSYLSEIVFSNPKQLEVLNAIVHPEVRKHFKNFVQNTSKPIVIYENAILFESKSDAYCDIVISVFTDLETRIFRVQQREVCTREAVLERVSNQFKESKKLMQSNYVIYNDDFKETEHQVQNICKKLTKKLRLI